MRVVVTGAGGFVGKVVCTALARAGHRVHACLRTAPPAPLWGDSLSVQVHTLGDLAEYDGWDALLEGADAVLHLAARVHQTDARAAKDEDAFYRDNVLATARLIEACQRAALPPQVVLLSTSAVLGYDSGTHPFTPDAPLAPYNAYGRSKAQAEALVQASGLPWSIVRIPLVYGEGVRANFFTLMRAVQRGVPLPFGCITNRRSVLGVHNLADALCRVLISDAARQRILHVTDHESFSTAQLVRLIAQAMHKTPRLPPVPPACIRLLSRAAGRPMLYHKLCGSLELEAHSSNQLLEWTPPHDTAHGIAETVRWFCDAQAESDPSNGVLTRASAGRA